MVFGSRVALVNDPHREERRAMEAALLAGVSTIVAAYGVTVRIPGAEAAIPVRGVFTTSGLVWWLENFVQNFVSFPPFGNVLLMLIGVGVLERSGFLSSAVRATFARAPDWLLPYGISAGTIRRSRDVPQMMAATVKTCPGTSSSSSRHRSSSGCSRGRISATLIAVATAEALERAHLTGFAGVLGLVLVATIANLFIVSGSALWSLLAPVMIPAFMLLGYDPAFIRDPGLRQKVLARSHTRHHAGAAQRVRGSVLGRVGGAAGSLLLRRHSGWTRGRDLLAQVNGNECRIAHRRRPTKRGTLRGDHCDRFQGRRR
jgi:AbgT putative transporter family